MTKSFRLTGRHVLFVIVAFFASVFIANSVFITLAIRSFPGEQEKKSYLQGLAFNERIADREAQELLGWKAEITEASLSSGALEIELFFQNSSATPISGLKISGVLARTTADGDDHTLIFEQKAPGLYRATAENVAKGLWLLDAEAVGARNEKFTLEKRLTLK